MNARLRRLAALFWLPILVAAVLWDGIREARLKRRLGPNYEGPLED